MELSVQLRSGSPVPVVAVGGELDLQSGPCLAECLQSLLQACGPVLALDLTGVRFIDCAGVGALVASYRAASQGGGRFLVVALSPCARRIVEITRLHDVLGERDIRDEPATRAASQGPASSASGAAKSVTIRSA